MSEIKDVTAMEGMVEQELGRLLLTYVKDVKLDWAEILESKSVKIVEEITDIFQGADAYPDDQMLVEDIMKVLHRYGISTGVCHEY